MRTTDCWVATLALPLTYVHCPAASDVCALSCCLLLMTQPQTQKKPCVGQCCEGGAFAPPTKLCR
jgi:hypothetical protein